MVELVKYINPKSIRILALPARDDVIHSLVDALTAEGAGVDPETLYKAVIDREKIVTTGIGMGVAIPHAKLSGFEDFHIAVGILDKGVDWNALDGNPVKLVFLIGGPSDKQTEYLQILSSITQAIKKEALRKKLILAKTSEEAYDQLKGI
ncbi:MAG: PTS sugar transporter subunit IIA [Chlamydiia bacterium]|nr:PTS sugar transporter subunit IIA [Chlamydiia bacterium]